MIRLFTLLLLAVLSFPGWGAIVYEEDWESVPLVYSLGSANDENSESVQVSGACYYKVNGYSYNSVELSTRYKRAGDRSLRIEERTSDTNEICPLKSDRDQIEKVPPYRHTNRSEIEFATNNRSWNELIPVGESVATGPGYVDRDEEIWWGTSYYFPRDEGTHNGNWWNLSGRFMIGQIFGMGNSSTPEIETLIGGTGKVHFQYRYSLSPTNENGTVISNPSPYTYFTTDTWHDVIYNWKRSIDGTGKLKVWHNGRQVADYTGPATLRDKPLAIFKAGLYPSIQPEGKIIVVYIDSHVIGDANSSLTEIQNAMSGVTPAALPKPPTSLTVGIQP